MILFDHLDRRERNPFSLVLTNHLLVQIANVVIVARFDAAIVREELVSLIRQSELFVRVRGFLILLA